MLQDFTDCLGLPQNALNTAISASGAGLATFDPQNRTNLNSRPKTGSGAPCFPSIHRQRLQLLKRKLLYKRLSVLGEGAPEYCLIVPKKDGRDV